MGYYHDLYYWDNVLNQLPMPVPVPVSNKKKWKKRGKRPSK